MALSNAHAHDSFLEKMRNDQERMQAIHQKIEHLVQQHNLSHPGLNDELMTMETAVALGEEHEGFTPIELQEIIFRYHHSPDKVKTPALQAEVSKTREQVSGRFRHVYKEEQNSGPHANPPNFVPVLPQMDRSRLN